MTVKEIVEEYLEAKGFDGLWSDAGGCACRIGDLAPCCGEMEACEPGYLGHCAAGDEQCEGCADNPGGWHIQRERT